EGRRREPWPSPQVVDDAAPVREAEVPEAAARGQKLDLDASLAQPLDCPGDEPSRVVLIVTRVRGRQDRDLHSVRGWATAPASECQRRMTAPGIDSARMIA